MRYFTNNPLERLMMQKPKAAREDSPPDAAKEHFCYGCKRFGQSCVRPCYLFFLRCVFVILESDLPFFLNGVMDLIHAVINTLILRFGGAVHIDMPIQLAGMRFTGELTQLFNKPFAFLGRNEAGGFHRVHQQF